MAAFAQLEWNRLDVKAIVENRGVSTILQHDQPRAKSWLVAHGYQVLTFDFADGIAAVLIQIGHALHWQKQFGYQLSGAPSDRNLDALRDGFSELPGNGALAMMFENAETLWRLESEWLLGFAAVINDASLWQLAVGARFFSLWAIASGHSAMVGQVVNQCTIGIPLRF